MTLRVWFTLVVALVASIVGCVASDGALTDRDGKALLATPEEIREAQEALRSIQSEGDMPANMEGGVLFDARVEEVTHHSDGSEVAKLEMTKVIRGSYVPGSLIDVQTPSVERGGVRFETGGQFRVFAVEVNGVLRTWASTGTVRID
jgi:hypothetical protein